MDGTSRRGAYSFFHRGKPALLMGAVLLAAAIASFMPAPRASAQAPERVLVLADTADGGLDSPEAQDAAALGFAVDVVDDSTWQSLTTHDFQGYRAIVLGDPYCGASSR